MRFPWIFLLIAALPARGEDLQFLDHSELALARLYTDISQATSTIDLTYLMWDPCSSASKVLMKKLREKTRKTAANPNPVKVRMLIDSYFHRQELGPMARYFAENGIEMRFFNPTSSPTGGNYHTHSKMALIDKKVAGKAKLITGGRNMTDDYYGMGTKNFIDRDVAVTGPSAEEDRKGVIGQADSGFDKLWANRMSRPVSPAGDADMGRLRACTKWTDREARLEKHLQEKAAAILARASPMRCQGVKFTVDSMAHADVQTSQIEMGDSGRNMPALPSERLPYKPTSQAVIDLVQGARSTLTMENQYFIPDDSFLKPILRAKRGRVNVDLYSNMFENSSAEKVELWHTHYMEKERSSSQRNHQNFRIAGMIDRWDFTPPRATYSYHAKTYVADGKDAIVSSFNIDPRSMHINGESALVVKSCPAFAKRVEDTAKLTGKVWTMEENYQTGCLGQARPQPPQLDPLQSLIQFISKDLQ